jgi:hypothetical protein
MCGLSLTCFQGLKYPVAQGMSGLPSSVGSLSLSLSLSLWNWIYKV